MVLATMPAVSRLVTLLFLFSTGYALSISTAAPETTNNEPLEARQDALPPTYGAVVLETDQGASNEFSMPNLVSIISSIFHHSATSTTTLTFLPSQISSATATPTTDTARVLSSVESSAIGGLFSILNTILNPLTGTTAASSTSSPVPTTDVVTELPAGETSAIGGLLSILNTILNPLTGNGATASAVTSTAASPTGLIPVSPLVSIISSMLSGVSTITPSTAASPGTLPTPNAPIPIPTSLTGSTLTPSPSPAMSLSSPLPDVTSAASTTGSADLSAVVASLTALLPTAPLPTALIPVLVSEITPLISSLGTDLPAVEPLLASLESMLVSEVTSGDSAVESLTALIASQVASLTQETFSGSTLVTAEVPVMSLELPSQTIPVPIPMSLLSQLSGLSLPTGAPLSELAATLSSIVGPANSGLVGSIVGAIASTLDSMVLNSEVSNIISEATVAAGSVASAVTQEWCSMLSMVGGTMVTVSVPCGSSSASTLLSEGPNSVISPPSPASASATTTGTAPAVTVTVFVLPSSTSSPITGPSAGASSGQTGGSAPSAANAPGSSTVYVTAISTQVVTVTAVEISVLTACTSTPLTSSLLCPSLPPCPKCPTAVPCTSSSSPSGSSVVSPVGGKPNPCPGQGYTCDDCIDHWFCPPPQTPALPAPCGYGWPCYHCEGGWFCVPSPPTLAPTTVSVCPESIPGNPTIMETSPLEDTTTRTTITSTAVVTVSTDTTPVETLHPGVAGWQYGGCYKDDAARALKNDSITVAIVGGMTTEMCIVFCCDRGFGLAGLEDGYQCFCGDVLIDSWLLGDSDCNIACAGDAGCTCGGSWALSVWSPDRKVPMAAGPEEVFVMPTVAPGQSAVSLNIGGVRQTVVMVTTPVFAWPPLDIASTTDTAVPAAAMPYAPYSSTTTTISEDGDPMSISATPTAIDVEGIASTVHAIVSAAMEEAQQLASSEVARANSMIADAKAVVGNGFKNMAGELNAVVAGAFPEKVAWKTCSTTVTSCSTTTTFSVTSTCTTGLLSSTPATATSPSLPAPSSTSSVNPTGVASAAPIQQSPTVPTTVSPPSPSGPSATPASPSVLLPPPGAGSLSPSGLSATAPLNNPTSPGSTASPSVLLPPPGVGSLPPSGPSNTAASTNPASPASAASPSVLLPPPGVDTASPSRLSVRPFSTLSLPGSSSETTVAVPSPSPAGQTPTTIGLSTVTVSSLPRSDSTGPSGTGGVAPIPNSPSTTGSPPGQTTSPSGTGVVAPIPNGPSTTITGTPPGQATTPSGTGGVAPIPNGPSTTITGSTPGQTTGPSGTGGVAPIPKGPSTTVTVTGSPPIQSPVLSSPSPASTGPSGTGGVAPMPNGPSTTITGPPPGQTSIPSPGASLQSSPSNPTAASGVMPSTPPTPGPTDSLPPMQTYIQSITTAVAPAAGPAAREARSFVA
ncbi:hypothetical protein B0T19DRAFT_283023 [Cercophora scortea]|uniref:WSC domain-containing protein n=1 Tax=Cercophora scortea TaxID=314031 RepID=A0AAE0I8C3_9PEZI|nr:hypothetical protein B0T19DRAFT_283023 [Cercophora scortea]